MGLGGISIWQLLIVLVIVLLLFGTKRLKNLGGDLGGAIKGFKKAMSDEDKNGAEEPSKAVEADEDSSLSQNSKDTAQSSAEKADK